MCLGLGNSQNLPKNHITIIRLDKAKTSRVLNCLRYDINPHINFSL
jgi:hypothetical protein